MTVSLILYDIYNIGLDPKNLSTKGFFIRFAVQASAISPFPTASLPHFPPFLSVLSALLRMYFQGMQEEAEIAKACAAIGSLVRIHIGSCPVFFAVWAFFLMSQV